MDERQPSAGSSVVLDIGGDSGAVVVYLPAVPRGGELEMRPAGDPTGRFHTGVHLRPVGGVRIPVAVFPTVRAGRYELLDDRLAPVAADVEHERAARCRLAFLSHDGHAAGTS